MYKIMSCPFFSNGVDAFFHFIKVSISISMSMCRSPKANFDNERIERTAKEKQTTPFDSFEL